MNAFLRLAPIACSMFLGACSLDPNMGDFDLALINGYYLVRTSPDSVEILHMDDSRHLGVPAKVVEIAWNEHFILAKQQELQPRGDFPGDTLSIPAPGKFHYWIVDTIQTNRYGPLIQKEFEDKLQSLGLSGLKLKDVSTVSK
jgi:Protein of unknown function (DUF3997)